MVLKCEADFLVRVLVTSTNLKKNQLNSIKFSEAPRAN